MTIKDQGKLKQAKDLLKAAGLKPQDYSHLSYEKILRLAGLKP